MENINVVIEEGGKEAGSGVRTGNFSKICQEVMLLGGVGSGKRWNC